MTKRADETTKACPTGHTACSPSTTEWYDVYCVPDTEYPASCPVLSVEFALPAETYSSDWTRLTFTDGLDLVYTKTAGSAGPISRPAVGQRPCLEPDQ